MNGWMDGIRVGWQTDGHLEGTESDDKSLCCNFQDACQIQA